MKKFAKLFVVALSVALIATMFALVPSAAEAEMIDPNTLVPASDRVVFIMDPERDPETHEIIGELPGDGTGTSAENPLAIVEHGSFNADAESPKYHLMTSFYQATEFLKETGGTIVVCGPIYFGFYESYGQAAASTKDVFTATFNDKTIKITSVYDGVDYRETNGAKITIETPAEIGVHGQTIWENVDIETTGTARVISFNNHATLVGEGVKCYPSDLEIYEGIATNYVSLSGGHRYAGGTDLTTNLVVKSGTYNIIAAGSWGVNNTRKYKDDGSLSYTNNLDGNTKAKLVIDGTTEVLGQVIGTNRQRAEFSGTTEVIINGGKFMCDINMTGVTGFVDENGKATLKINGGDFSYAWSINDADAACAGNLPGYSLLDVTGWKGDKTNLAYVYALTTVFSEVKLPEGTDTDELVSIYQKAEEAKATATEEDDETSAPDAEDTTKAPDGEDTTKAPVTTAKPETTSPETTAPVKDGDNGGDMTLWIIIGVVAVVVVAAVVAVVLMKKKAAK